MRTRTNMERGRVNEADNHRAVGNTKGKNWGVNMSIRRVVDSL
jgi:hypothetical protein